MYTSPLEASVNNFCELASLKETPTLHWKVITRTENARGVSILKNCASFASKSAFIFY